MRKGTERWEQARDYFITVLVYGLFIVIFIIFTSEILGETNIVTTKPPFLLSEFSQLVGAGGSLVLSLALVVLYRRQTENQETLQTMEHKPNLQVDRFRRFPNEEFTDSYEFEISNVGKAAATDLQLIIIPKANNHSQTSLKKTSHRMKRTKIEESGWRTTNDSYINSGETNVRFFSSAGMNVDNLTHIAAFPKATELFDDNNGQDLQLRLLLRYSSPIADSESQKIVELVAPISGGMSLDEYLDQVDRQELLPD
ncbi:hypothetical protein [Haloarcula amylolytica]|uniref:hypothetical protein n=1 Tax=Haloarcula amylolytica TaxID=396317 RepID=UPI003C774DAF